MYMRFFGNLSIQFNRCSRFGSFVFVESTPAASSFSIWSKESPISFITPTLSAPSSGALFSPPPSLTPSTNHKQSLSQHPERSSRVAVMIACAVTTVASYTEWHRRWDEWVIQPVNLSHTWNQSSLVLENRLISIINRYDSFRPLTAGNAPDAIACGSSRISSNADITKYPHKDSVRNTPGPSSQERPCRVQ